MNVRTPLHWIGGKGRLVAKFLPLLPSHNHYVEPFGGGGSVLIAKKPCRGNETFNDLSKALVDFFRVLSDEQTFEKFYRRVAPLPCSRDIYNDARETWEQTEDRVERVAKWFVVARQSFGGIFGCSWGTVTESPKGSWTGSWISTLQMLPGLHARLQLVQIENDDYRTVLKRYNGAGYLAYCDPPYVTDTRVTETVYDHEMTNKDHRELVSMLLEYDGAVVLSGYRHRVYQPLEDAGWERLDIETCCAAAGRTAGSGLKGKGASLKKQPRTECVWRNPIALRRVHSRRGGFFEQGMK